METFFFKPCQSQQTDLIIDWEKLARQYVAYNKILAETKFEYEQDNFFCPKIPNSLRLRDYQQTAVANWLQNKGRGTLKMATGSGKTITALAIATELYQKIGLEVLLVICPYRHLVTQWARECEKFNLQPILAFESVYNWEEQLSTQLYNIYSKHQKFLTVITTNSTLISESFQLKLKFFPEKTLIVGDEAHNLGSTRLEESLPRRIGLRLALSATPERFYDFEGSEGLLDYFGEILQPEFSLADALREKALVPYVYNPVFVHLTEAEALVYAKLTKRIGWLLNDQKDLLGNDENLTSLLTKRSRLIGAAANKLSALKALMSKRLHTSHTLFYCGDGQVDGGDPIYRQQLRAVTRLLGNELGYRVNTYTAETPIQEREKLRSQFESGELQGLVAIRCLDEGVDIPSIETAVILASSSNPRQFIQRRGRVLRPFPGKKYATLFDMIVVPPDLPRETWEVEKNLLRKELTRFLEFANLAKNATKAINKLMTLQQKYDLLDERNE